MVAALLLASLATSSRARAAELRLEPYSFVSSRGDTVAAELGTLRVPERRARPKGRTIELAFVRFRSTGANPGAPIVYLAGGPGQSGIEAARGRRFPLFMALRRLGDVIALDQRGVGRARPQLTCDQTVTLPTDRPLDFATSLAALRGPAEACAEQWRSEGVDLAAYNTVENAADLESLRLALGASKLRLWAISYGTHLALAAIRRHPESIESAVLAGVEGPDHTLKLPSNTERLLEEIARRAERDSATHAQVPNLIETLRTVMAGLEKAPARLRIPDDRTKDPADSLDFVLGRDEAAGLFAALLGSGEAQGYFPAFVHAASRGDFALLSRLSLVRFRARSPADAMTFAMDCASGATAARRKRIAEEAPRTTLGDATNPEQLALCDLWRVSDLGDGFRSELRPRVPALFISGTLDLNTPPSNAEEVRRGFANSSHLVIDGAAHSDPLFLASPRILERMLAFFAGPSPAADERIEVPFQFRHDLERLAAYLK